MFPGSTSDGLNFRVNLIGDNCRLFRPMSEDGSHSLTDTHEASHVRTIPDVRPPEDCPGFSELNSETHRLAEWTQVALPVEQAQGQCSGIIGRFSGFCEPGRPGAVVPECRAERFLIRVFTFGDMGYMEGTAANLAY